MNLVDLGVEFIKSTLAESIIWSGGVLAIILFIRKVSKDADDELNQHKREELSQQLKQLMSNGFSKTWIPNFTSIFDRFFGSKHISWRCFYRSALISFISLAILIIINPPPLATKATPIYQDILFSYLVVLPLACNVIIDYISLLETRMILNTQIGITAKLIIDAILTFLLTLLWLAFLIWLVLNMVFLLEVSYMDSLRSIWVTFIGTEQGTYAYFIRCVVGTSFITSIWFWLHGLAQFSIFGMKNATWVMSFLNVEKKPLRAIGTTINVIIIFIGVAIFPLFIILK